MGTHTSVRRVEHRVAVVVKDQPDLAQQRTRPDLADPLAVALDLSAALDDDHERVGTVALDEERLAGAERHLRHRPATRSRSSPSQRRRPAAAATGARCPREAPRSAPAGRGARASAPRGGPAGAPSPLRATAPRGWDVGRARRGPAPCARAVRRGGCPSGDRRAIWRITGCSRSTMIGARPRLISSIISTLGRPISAGEREHLLLAARDRPARRFSSRGAPGSGRGPPPRVPGRLCAAPAGSGRARSARRTPTVVGDQQHAAPGQLVRGAWRRRRAECDAEPLASGYAGPPSPAATSFCRRRCGPSRATTSPAPSSRLRSRTAGTPL